jgi:hypothetical protein
LLLRLRRLVVLVLLSSSVSISLDRTRRFDESFTGLDDISNRMNDREGRSSVVIGRIGRSVLKREKVNGRAKWKKREDKRTNLVE